VTLITLALLAALGPGGNGAYNSLNPLVSKVKEHEELIQKLQRDIFKVDRAIGETEKLIAKSRNAPYLPDLQFRLAELYVEKSRYVYYLQAESRPEGVKGAMVSPETRLLKQKAVSLYQRLLREYPDFHDGDKVTFYLAHENREMGQFDEMLKILGDLARKYPQSLLRLDAEQIIGDFYFDKADLVEAEKHYQAVLEAPPSAVHDLARYKMGWVRINQNRHADAVTFFEAAAASAPVPGVDPKKALNVKREALLDLVYSYTEARPAKGALNYFEKLSDSRSTYALALEKLGNRYFIKQQYEFAIPALRRLMQIQPDPEMDGERVFKLYDSVRAAKGKVAARPEDLQFIVRAAVELKTDPTKDEPERKKALAEFEEIARDLSTQLHVLAQRQDQQKMYLDSAEAYRVYLSLFRPERQVRAIMQNRADALFAAHAYPAAARQFEELARYQDKAKDVKGLDTALYGALLSHFSALKTGEVEKITAFEVADARQALKLLGARYIARFPRNEHVLEIKFNIARAYYDDGEFERSGELFTKFALDHSDYKDAATAGHLAMDSLRQRYDFKGLEETGRKFIASRLPAPFVDEVKKILTQSRAEALDELALRSSAETGDVVAGLEKVAAENKGAELGEKALYGAFTAARDKRDLAKEKELALRLMQEYPKSGYLSNALLTLGRHAAEAAHFQDAAGYYELVGQKLRGDASALDGWLAGARLRIAMTSYKDAIHDLESAADIAGARKAEVLALLAQTRIKTHELPKAKATAQEVLKLSKTNAAAAAVLAEAEAGLGGKPEPLIPVLTAVTNGPEGQGEDSAKALWYLGETMYRNFRAIPGDQVEQKVAALQQLVGIYTQSASMGSPEWAVASLWKLGLAYQHIADAVEASPVPAGLSGAQVQQFRNAVKEQVAPLKDQAEDAFKTCLSRASQLEVFTPAVAGCRGRTDSPRANLPGNVAPAAGPANLAELQRKAETAMDPAALEALGVAYLEARQMGLAQLTLSRATELEENRASAQNALGVSLLYSGEPMAARSAYGKALDADPTHEKARANLAALRCRFGDEEGAKRELSVLKDVSALRGADVDPEWKACR
jgi:tetratricopeptide (TPR) repeat protein